MNSSPQPVFRPYASNDKTHCLAMFQGHVGTYFAAGERQEFEEFLAGLESPSKEREVHYWVGFLEGQPVACGGVESGGSIASLVWGMVGVDLTGRGIGKALLLHRLHWIRENLPNVKTVKAHTAPLTEGFFAARGFKAYKTEPRYWGGEIDLVAMELSL